MKQGTLVMVALTITVTIGVSLVSADARKRTRAHHHYRPALARDASEGKTVEPCIVRENIDGEWLPENLPFADLWDLRVNPLTRNTRIIICPLEKPSNL